MPQSKPKPCFLQRPNRAIAGDWPLDDGGGLTVADRSGTGANGTFTGGITWTTGVHGSCVSTDGTSGFITLPNPLNGISTPMTFWAWVNAPNQSFYGFLLDTRRVSDGQGALLYLDKANGFASAFFAGGGAGNFSLAGSTNVFDAKWHFLTLTVGEAASAVARLYVDGILVAGPTIVTAYPINSPTFLLNHAYDGAFAQGLVDCFGIANLVMTPAQINNLMADTFGRFRRHVSPHLVVVPPSPNFTLQGFQTGPQQPGTPWFKIAAVPAQRIDPPPPPPPLLTSPPAFVRGPAQGTPYSHILIGDLALQVKAPVPPPLPSVPVLGFTGGPPMPGSPWFQLSPGPILTQGVPLPPLPASATVPLQPFVGGPPMPGAPWFILSPGPIPSTPPPGGLPPTPPGHPSPDKTFLPRVPDIESQGGKDRLVRFTNILSDSINSLAGRGQIVQVSQAGYALVAPIVSNGPPGPGNDQTQGFRVGSFWLDQSVGHLYICTSATAGSAVWKLIV